MSDVVVVSGTDTEVGKTWVTARVVEAMLGGGAHVAVRKPVQSFDGGDRVTDAEILAAASGEPRATVCPPHRSYEVALAPPMAAEVLGRPRILIKEIVAEIALPTDTITIVEGVGGARSPLAHDGDTVALARALGATAVVLVAPPGLGTINAVRLGVAAFAPLPAIVYLNHFAESDEIHERNRKWLSENDGFEVCCSIAGLCEILIARLGKDVAGDRPEAAPMEVG